MYSVVLSLPMNTNLLIPEMPLSGNFLKSGNFRWKERTSEKMKQCLLKGLKALFNKVFTLKNLSCISLHAISVFDTV